jgi:hypothetical protein
MDELANLNEFDNEIDQAVKNIATLQRTRGTTRGVFPAEQDAQFKQLFDAVAHILLATQYLAKNLR